MIDAITFYRSIQEISTFSDSLNDNWTIQDDNIPENAILIKKTKLEISSRILTFEYHIIYNVNYSVPTLFLNIYKSDGAPITNIEECQQLLNLSEKRYVLMQQEHPRLHVPFMTFHPCKTSEIMEVFANKTRNPVVSWISAISPFVRLDIPVAYAQLT